MKGIFRALLLAIFPTWLVRGLVNALGYNLEKGARVGLSWVRCDGLKMAATSRIWHFSKLTGPFSVELSEKSYIGHFINVTRARIGIAYGTSKFTLGRHSNVTSRHRLDLCQSITVGDFSTIAGNGSQLWTHGYVHDEAGLDRYRIDGPITIGSNVYIGSMCFISMGVEIADGVIVGGGSSVAKNLSEPGMYVSGSLRKLPRPAHPDSRSDLAAIPKDWSMDRVYAKRKTP